MVTGDNLLTALSVARECGIIVPNKSAYLIEHENGVVDRRGRTVLTIREVSIIFYDKIDHELIIFRKKITTQKDNQKLSILPK